MNSAPSSMNTAVDALLACESRYRLLFDLIQEGFLLCEAVLEGPEKVKDWLILDVNPAFTRLTGRAQEDVLGKTLLALAPETEPHWLEAYRKVAFGVESLVVEGTSGARGHWYRCSMYSPQPGQVACLFSDITERKLAEARAQQKESLLALFLEAAPAAFAMLDKELRFLFASQRLYQDYLRCQTTDIVGRALYDIFPELPERAREVLRRCLEEGASGKGEEDAVQRRDGSLDWMQWECRPWRDGSGAIGGVVVLTERITDRKLAERALQESEARFRRVFDTSPAPAALFHRDKRTLALNACFVAAFGYTLEDLPDAEAWWSRAYPDPDQHQAACDAHASLVAGTLDLQRAQRCITCKDGRVLRMDATFLRQGDFVITSYNNLHGRIREERGPTSAWKASPLRRLAVRVRTLLAPGGRRER